MSKQRILKASILSILSCSLLFSNVAYSQPVPVNKLADSESSFVEAPSPFEITLILSRIGGKINLPAPSKLDSNDMSAIALAGGITIADIMAALKEKDKEKTLAYSGMLYSYAEQLKVDPVLLKTYAPFASAVKNGEWKLALIMVNDMAAFINFALARGMFVNEAKLANISSWLEGLRLVSETILKDYRVDKAAVILQYEELIFMLLKQYQSLPENLKSRWHNGAFETLNGLYKVIKGKKTLDQKDVEELVSLLNYFRGLVYS